MAEIKFGTDGWRAIISEDFTFENVKIVAQAIADFVKSERSPIYRKKKIAVGYDTRFLSSKYAELVSSVLVSNGIKVVLSEDNCTTPSICIYIKDKKLSGGVMITASHNPAEYNGIKYKGYFGGSAGSDIIGKIEKNLRKSKVKYMDINEAIKSGKVVKDDFVSMQNKWIKKYADMKILKKAKLRVLVDSMNGTGRDHLKEVVRGTKIKLDFINDELNPGFKGRAPEPKAENLKELITKVKNGKYNLGIATDGDSDRLAVVDEKGNVLSGHKLMALLLLHLVEDRKMRGGVVQTICGTGLIDKIAKEYHLKTYETPVGFKYICDIMIKKDILIAGEETGGIGFKNYVPERDGFLSTLLLIEFMLAKKKTLSRIVEETDKKYGEFVYGRKDVVFVESKRKALVDGMKKNPLKEILGKKVVDIKSYDGTKFICEDGTWLILRLSGTEPKLRIYCEAHSKPNAAKYLEFGQKYASKFI